jgi:hypothetical protein
MIIQRRRSVYRLRSQGVVLRLHQLNSTLLDICVVMFLLARVEDGSTQFINCGVRSCYVASSIPAGRLRV